MLRSVYYGPHKIQPWCPGTGYLDRTAKNLKSYRCREPSSIWQSLNAKTEDLGTYDLYICRHCFSYTSVKSDIDIHQKLCRYKEGHPGKLIYEDSKYRYYEIYIRDAGEVAKENLKTSSGLSEGPDSIEESVKLYLQSLSLLGHLFLDTKSICFNVESFLFYTAVEKSTKFVAGFFSKEKHSWHDYNLACIVIFPPWQKHGLGRRLIQSSYWLSKNQNVTGSPEKPSSAHGQQAYESYWANEIAKFLISTRDKDHHKHATGSSRKAKSQITSISQISQATMIEKRDIWELLRSTGALRDGQIYVKRLLTRDKKELAPEIHKDDSS